MTNTTSRAQQKSQIQAQYATLKEGFAAEAAAKNGGRAPLFPKTSAAEKTVDLLVKGAKIEQAKVAQETITQIDAGKGNYPPGTRELAQKVLEYRGYQGGSAYGAGAWVALVGGLIGAIPGAVAGVVAGAACCCCVSQCASRDADPCGAGAGTCLGVTGIGATLGGSALTVLGLPVTLPLYALDRARGKAKASDGFTPFRAVSDMADKLTR